MIKKYSYNFDFFKWIKKTELVELNEINPEDDPVRPELDNNFRTSMGRKIFGLKYNDEIEGVVCIAFTNDKKIGKVTSAVFSPRLNKNIALAMISIDNSQINNSFDVKIVDEFFRAQVVKKPFYDPKKQITSKSL